MLDGLLCVLLLLLSHLLHPECTFPPLRPVSPHHLHYSPDPHLGKTHPITSGQDKATQWKEKSCTSGQNSQGHLPLLALGFPQEHQAAQPQHMQGTYTEPRAGRVRELHFQVSLYPCVELSSPSEIYLQAIRLYFTFGILLQRDPSPTTASSAQYTVAIVT